MRLAITTKAPTGGELDETAWRSFTGTLADPRRRATLRRRPASSYVHGSCPAGFVDVAALPAYSPRVRSSLVRAAARSTSLSLSGALVVLDGSVPSKIAQFSMSSPSRER